MNDDLFDKKIKCPVCSNSFNVTKAKFRASRVASRDADFCVHYEGINPLYYDVWVCEHCGYAAQQAKFHDISVGDADIITRELTPNWKKRSFSGERDLDTAIDTFKILLYNLQLQKAKSSEFAKVCIRLAWLNRFKMDKDEQFFLKHALKYYINTYETEDFPADKLDEYTCMYMIGELSRRTGNYKEAVIWLSKLISMPEARKNKVLIETAREQYQLVKSKLRS